MKKFTSLTFLAVALLFLITISSISAQEIERRNNVCSEYHYKRNILGKRTNVKKCPCALANAVFDGSGGGVTGLTIFAQDECGSTTITGFFSKGFEDPNKHNYTFAITDDCGNIIHDLGTLGATFADGGTKPFSKKFDNFNLNCDKNGILLQPSAKYSKRTYDECKKTYYKRQASSGGSDLTTYQDGNSYSSATISSIFDF